MALRVVKPSEKPPRRVPKNVLEAAQSGTHRELLVAMRDRIARTVDAADCPPRDLAALSRRLVEIGRAIDAIDVAAKQEAERGGDVPDAAFDATTL